MELPAIGENCSEPSCKQLDFLPLNCDCGKKFCSDHFGAHAVKCSSIQAQSSTGPTNVSNVYMCSHPDCIKTSPVSLICEKCNKHFCIAHRHINECEADPIKLAMEKEKFEAPVRQFKEAKAAVDKEITDKLNETRKRGKNMATANKIQLMLIKNKATGLKSIPPADRIYFSIVHPRKVRDKVTPVFVSKDWTVGRAIDAIAEELRVVNNNNKKNELKLRLFKKETGAIISSNVSSILDNLIDSKCVYNGENLILEYVNEDCTEIDLK